MFRFCFICVSGDILLFFFFFNDTATTEIYTYLHTLSLHDALPILGNTRIWSRGVDFTQFGPDRRPHPALSNLPRPVLLSVGRVAVEKNLDAFLSAKVQGTKEIGRAHV